MSDSFQGFDTLHRVHFHVVDECTYGIGGHFVRVKRPQEARQPPDVVLGWAEIRSRIAIIGSLAAQVRIVQDSIGSSVKCFFPHPKPPPFLVTPRSKNLTSRMDQETEGTSACLVAIHEPDGGVGAEREWPLSRATPPSA